MALSDNIDQIREARYGACRHMIALGLAIAISADLLVWLVALDRGGTLQPRSLQASIGGAPKVFVQLVAHV